MKKQKKKKMTIDALARMMQGEFTGVNKRLGDLEADIKEIKENSSELFAKLDEFISLYRDTKQELASLSKQLRRVEERLAQLEGKT